MRVTDEVIPRRIALMHRTSSSRPEQAEFRWFRGGREIIWRLFFFLFFFLAVLTMARPRGSACITAKGYSRVETRDKSRSTPVTWHGKDRQRLLPRRNENKVHSEIRNILSLPLKDAHPCRHRRVRNPTFFLCCPERECVCLANVILASTNQSLFPRN